MEWNSFNKSLERSIKEHWDRPALSNYRGDTLAYRDLAERIFHLHILFEKCGLKKGDRVALCSRNQANWAVCFLASLTYGAVSVPILHEFKAENIHYLVNHSDARVFFADETIWEGLSDKEMPDVLAVVRMSDFGCLYSREKYVAEPFPDDFSKDDVSYDEENPEDLAMINYTSGTSEFSKGVMIPFRSVLFNLRFSRSAEPQMGPDSEVVAMLPSAHMYGMMFEFLYEIMIGAHVHFLTKVPSPKIIVNAFSEINPALIVAVPLIIEKLYKSKMKQIADRSRPFRALPVVGPAIRKKIRNRLIDAFGGKFEEVIIGGAAFNPEVESFLRDIRFPFTVGYGMTECGPIITYSKWDKTRQGTCGTAVPGCQIRIDSADPHSVPGEIQIKGDNIFLGYYKNPKATAEVFTGDGWFRTGDIGIIDEDGYLYLRGRSKCMILGPSGQNIYPEELETVINNADYVVDSLVIEDDGALVALIYPDYHLAEADGMDSRQLEDCIIKSLPEINRTLPSYAQIRRVELMREDFERTPKRSIKRFLYQRNVK